MKRIEFFWVLLNFVYCERNQYNKRLRTASKTWSQIRVRKKYEFLGKFFPGLYVFISCCGRVFCICNGYPSGWSTYDLELPFGGIWSISCLLGFWRNCISIPNRRRYLPLGFAPWGKEMGLDECLGLWMGALYNHSSRGSWGFPFFGGTFGMGGIELHQYLDWSGHHHPFNLTQFNWN